MLNTFADVFGDESSSRPVNGSTNPFDISSNEDPFGISTTMKLSQSSEKFDGNPFAVEPTVKKSVRPRSGKDALSSTNWLAYQHSMDEANLDPTDDLPEPARVAAPEIINPLNPFSDPTTSSSSEIIAQISSMNLFFDMNIDQTPSPVNESAPVQLPSVAPPHVVPPSSLTATPSAALPLSALNSPFNDQFLDWMTQTDSLMCSVDPKLSAPSKKMDINLIKSTEDLLGSIHRPAHTLSTLRTYSTESHPTDLFALPLSFQKKHRRTVSPLRQSPSFDSHQCVGSRPKTFHRFAFTSPHTSTTTATWCRMAISITRRRRRRRVRTSILTRSRKCSSRSRRKKHRRAETRE